MTRRAWIATVLFGWTVSCSSGPAPFPRPMPPPVPEGEDAGPLGDGGAEAAPVAPRDAPVPPAAQGLVDRALRNLQQRMALGSTDEIRIVSVEEVEWGDTSLDCPDPEMQYRRENTPGFLILLEAADRTYEYHSDTAYSIILCKDGRPVRSGS
ncbi:MAG: hypothetical protein JXB32_04540 [Deltaproteobacteria bacterium]|nr:hypothetical protein [Deltaproteobacteria bacterium]